MSSVDGGDAVNSRWQTWLAKTAWLGVVVASIIASYVAVGALRQRVAESGKVDAGPGRPFEPANGTHLIVYVVGAAECGWSNHPSMLSAYKTIRNVLRTFHGSKYAQITVIGVAIDQDINVGLKYLSTAGGGRYEDAFDQIVVGGSWLNEEIVRFAWQERATKASTPQIVLVERPVSAEGYRQTYTLGVEKDRVLAVKIGAESILAWINQGAPLNDGSKVSLAK
jgi:hypothetical protein